jgi:hypothetical protein
MTRSEEEMHVGTERREAGRARLRKYVVTKEQQQTIPVRHEEVRVERQPITEENRGDALAGPEIRNRDKPSPGAPRSPDQLLCRCASCCIWLSPPPDVE